MHEYTYTFDQIKESEDVNLLTFMDYDFSARHGGVNPKIYFTADHGTISAASPVAACEKLFTLYNANRPADYRGRSMSVSDIVNLWDNSTDTPVKTSWFCDSYGFVQIDDQGKRRTGWRCPLCRAIVTLTDKDEAPHYTYKCPICSAVTGADLWEEVSGNE